MNEAKGYELVLQREPDNQTALRGLLEAKLKMGDRKGAIAPLAKLAELNPSEPDYGILLAQAQKEAGDLEAAAATYRTLLDRQPNSLKALQGLATLLVEQQRPQAAVGLVQESLDQAIAANKSKPNSADVVSIRLLLGEVYVKLERYDDAIAAFDKALEGNPKDFRPVLAKAIVLRNQGKTQQAEELFATAAGLAPDRFKDQIRKLAATEPGAEPTPAASPSPSPAQP
jgi:tetratricopeptide (TPR) repeat protein